MLMTVSDYYDPTGGDDAFRKLLVVDGCRCFIEVVDTAGHSACTYSPPQIVQPTERSTGDYAALWELWARHATHLLHTCRATDFATAKAKPVC